MVGLPGSRENDCAGERSRISRKTRTFSCDVARCPSAHAHRRPEAAPAMTDAAPVLGMLATGEFFGHIAYTSLIVRKHG
jgi:hypothetical protein